MNEEDSTPIQDAIDALERLLQRRGRFES